MNLKNLHMKILRRIPAHERLFSAHVEISGKKFISPKINNTICNLSEPWMVVLLDRILKVRAGSFLDVGVNIGQTLLAVKATDPSRRYIGVEPNSFCVAYTERLIALNGLSDCVIVPVGIADSSGIRKLHLYYGTDGDLSASLVDNFRPEQVVSLVKLVPVIPFLEIAQVLGIAELGVVKIDVEGGEAEVLASMRNALVSHKPWLIVEILPCYDAKSVDRLDRQRSIERLLREVGYSMFCIVKSPAGDLQHLQAIDEIGIHGNLALSDYVFCPHGDVSTLGDTVHISI